MILIINRTLDASSSGTGCVLRTENLELWLQTIAKLNKQYHFNKRNCRWFKHTYSNGKEITFFSFPEDKTAYYYWKDMKFTRKPEFLFKGMPEGALQYA